MTFKDPYIMTHQQRRDAIIHDYIVDFNKVIDYINNQKIKDILEGRLETEAHLLTDEELEKLTGEIV